MFGSTVNHVQWTLIIAGGHELRLVYEGFIIQGNLAHCENSIVPRTFEEIRRRRKRQSSEMQISMMLTHIMLIKKSDGDV